MSDAYGGWDPLHAQYAIYQSGSRTEACDEALLFCPSAYQQDPDGVPSQLSSSLPIGRGPLTSALFGQWQPPTFLAPSVAPYAALTSRAPTPVSAAAGIPSHAFTGSTRNASARSLSPFHPPPLPQPVASTSAYRASPLAQAVEPAYQQISRSAMPVSLPASYNGFDLAPLTAKPVTYFSYDRTPGADAVPDAREALGMPLRRTKSDAGRPFKCKSCPQSFLRGHDLRRHEKIHLEIKPYPCGWCEKTFSRRDALKRHLTVKTCGEGLGQTQEWSERGISRAPSLLARESDAPRSASSTRGSTSDKAESPRSFDIDSPSAMSPESEPSISPLLRHATIASMPSLGQSQSRELPPNHLTLPPLPTGFAVQVTRQYPPLPTSHFQPPIEETARRSPDSRAPSYESLTPLYVPSAKRASPPAFVSHPSFASFASEDSTPSSVSTDSSKSPFFSNSYLPMLGYHFGLPEVDEIESGDVVVPQ